MKKLIIASLLLTSQVFAASVNITSFNYINTTRGTQGLNVLAEICGTVEGATSHPSYVRIVSDYNTNRPAVYNTLAGEDGKFCMAIITFRGTAQTTVMGSKKAVNSQI